MEQYADDNEVFKHNISLSQINYADRIMFHEDNFAHGRIEKDIEIARDVAKVYHICVLLEQSLEDGYCCYSQLFYLFTKFFGGGRYLSKFRHWFLFPLDFASSEGGELNKKLKDNFRTKSGFFFDDIDYGFLIEVYIEGNFVQDINVCHVYQEFFQTHYAGKSHHFALKPENRWESMIKLLAAAFLCPVCAQKIMSCCAKKGGARTILGKVLVSLLSTEVSKGIMFQSSILPKSILKDSEIDIESWEYFLKHTTKYDQLLEQLKSYGYEVPESSYDEAAPYSFDGPRNEYKEGCMHYKKGKSIRSYESMTDSDVFSDPEECVLEV